MNIVDPQPTPPIDIPLLLDRCMDDAALAIMVLESFSQQAASDLAELSSSLERNDAEGLSRRAHALKGSSGAIAAAALMNAACRLEEAACERRSEAFADMFGGISVEMNRCLESLPEVVRQLRPRNPS